MNYIFPIFTYIEISKWQINIEYYGLNAVSFNKNLQKLPETSSSAVAPTGRANEGNALPPAVPTNHI